jgi:hypothetical protein
VIQARRRKFVVDNIEILLEGSFFVLLDLHKERDKN